MKNSIVSFLVGVLFAVGLGVSGMTQPQKVIGFLDVFQNWDPSLMFVMIGAIAVHSIFYLFIKNKPSPLLSPSWHIPTRKDITPSLIIGSALFGMGWGIAGFCPGPAITSLVTFDTRIFLFVGSMIAGMFLHRVIPLKRN